VAETQLRNLRRAKNVLEEENAALERQIEQWTREAEKLETDTRHKNLEHDSCVAYGRAVKNTIVSDFSSLSVPCMDMTETERFNLVVT
jgi:predicted  nucleic acid-binding Zn-ribbon protein